LNKRSILLLSGYHARSHEYWCQQLTEQLSEFNWTQLQLPDRHFYWRVRSNALTFAAQHREQLERRYDLIVATSMVDLCNLRGLIPRISQVPSVLYFHENQFAYPERQPSRNIINAQLTSIYSAVSADQLVFNSVYNRDSFFGGAAAMLHKMPDGVQSDLLSTKEATALVVPVAIGDSNVVARQKFNSTVQIVWNHRWEYDKQPEVFFRAIEKLIDKGVDLQVHVMGQSFREIPACFDEFHSRHAKHILTWGYQPPLDYIAKLKQADIVVSSALHDFQGLGMLEAIDHGCTPVAPDRMAYGEYIPQQHLYPVSKLSGPDEESDRLVSRLLDVLSVGPARIATDGYHTAAVTPRYRALFKALVNGD